MPLIVAGGSEEPLTQAHAEARKIHPRYARGDLQRITVVPNLSEAELIKGMLLEQGIPSLIRRSAGFDVPDFLAAGPRDILVPAAGAEAAREMLSDVELAVSNAEPGDPDEQLGEGFGRSYAFKLAAALLAALLVFGAIAGVVYTITP